MRRANVIALRINLISRREKGESKDATTLKNYLKNQRAVAGFLEARAHRVLIDVYRVMKSGELYCDVGAEAVYQRRGANRDKAMIMSLQRAGYIVTKASAV
jgi:hypothetical protein